VYEGQIIVPPGKDNVTFEGEGTDKSIISYGFNTNEPNPEGVARHFRGTAVVVLADGFHAFRVTFRNISGDHGQALALRIDGDKAVIRECRIFGWQDTLMVNDHRQYFRDDYIEGRVDFIYGSGTAVFDHCEIRSKNGGYVTAASTPKDHAYGLIFLDCKLTGDPTPWRNPTGDSQPKPPSPPVAALGRPWRPYAMVAFIRCNLGKHIRPDGWDNWGNPANEQTARYSEYKSSGPGAAPRKRVSWSHQLTDQEAATFTVRNILRGEDGWDPHHDQK
jgi:pectinesterase